MDTLITEIMNNLWAIISITTFGYMAINLMVSEIIHDAKDNKSDLMLAVERGLRLCFPYVFDIVENTRYADDGRGSYPPKKGDKWRIIGYRKDIIFEKEFAKIIVESSDNVPQAIENLKELVDFFKYIDSHSITNLSSAKNRIELNKLINDRNSSEIERRIEIARSAVFGDGFV